MEKVITVYDKVKKEIVGLIIVEEIELGYIKDKIIIFSDNNTKPIIFALLSSFENRYVNTHNFYKNLGNIKKSTKKAQNIHFLEPFMLKSNNNNKSSRYKRILNRMNLSHLERIDYNVVR